MNFNFKKAQGALEYLLIVGAAILVAVIVMSLISGIGNSNRDNVQEADDGFQRMIDQTIIPPIISSVSCGDGSQVSYVVSESPTKGVVSYCVVLDGVIDDDHCESDIVNGMLVFDYAAAARTPGNYDFGLVAIKNQAYSRPTAPSFSCRVE